MTPQTSDNGILISLPWETRNLGIPAFRVGDEFADKGDDEALRSGLAKARHEHKSFFAQARVQIDSNLALALERNGFYFVEATVCPVAILDRNDPLRRYSTNPGAFLPKRYSPSDLQITGLDRAGSNLRDAVRLMAGESFSDDRFHRDHNCEPDVAGRRFKYWIDDLLGDAGVVFDVMLLKSVPVAFMARKADNLILAGFARKYVGAGLGDFLWLHSLREMQAAGLGQARTLISLSNIPVLNLYARLGFKFREPGATFHYWTQSESKK